MIHNAKVVLTEVLKALLDKLPIGIVITRNDKSIIMSNIFFREAFTEEQFNLQISMFINKGLVPGENTPFILNGRKGMIRKEVDMVFEEEYQYYFFSLSSSNDFNKIDKSEELFFKDLIEMADDSLVVVDTEGYVQILTRSFADFLGVDQERSIGKHVTEVIENTRMHIVVKTGNSEIAEPQKIKEDYIIATRSPVVKQGKIVGAVGKVLFNNMKQLTALSKRISSLNTELNKSKGIISARNKAYYTFDHLIGKSPVFMEVKNQAKKAAKSDSNVLILGESGTGKELFAHSIHNDSRRSMGAFVKVNCAAIPAELIESELFGYEGGSFTGAKKGGKVGKFEVADGGTIFLDEIGELPLHMQVKLLRVLQEKEIERVGATGTIPINVRIMAATNRNLEEMVAKREFRLDLYYRLKVMQITVPSLKERTEDIKILVYYFLEKYQNLMKKSVKGVNEHAIYLLCHYSWPGNIRELENTIERALNMVEEGEFLAPEHFPEEIIGYKIRYSNRSLAEVIEETECNTISDCLRMMDGNKSETARHLGISRTSLYEKMNKYKI
ncbi:sigma-54 interaction domain-containing protein [Neobacillus drentensis]|uniref:sigma-54 interaction domain-containing protein n=1 Tax=Neobacillus drentensis TaxID=220684 RepID=UPI00285D46F2|nr:sigma 54-interacting transcriptional regulator [Neobacillus drentensis]MDR7237596.1 transcriptional regulator with PAS, ATPase and Fis domain [Neobacillus drentensis]